MRVCFNIILFVLVVVSARAQVSLVNFPRPCGIYALGTLNGSVSEIRPYSFVDGFVIRKDWTSFEVQKDVYNWSYLDAIVRNLDSLNQSLTLDILRMKAPSYILSMNGVEKYTLTVGPQTFTTTVPWDSIVNVRFNMLMDSVANHPIYSIAAGTKVALKNHPVLKQMDASPIGMNGIRDIYNQLTTLPSYNRTKFIKSLLQTANTVITKFPSQFAFVAIFGINDNVSSSQLTQCLRDSLMRRFNRNYPPKLGFFQENLACSTPVASNNNSLYLMRDSTFTLNQMLQAWQNPFLTPANTNNCISTNGGPDVAILYGLNTFKSTYFEIYNADLDHTNYNLAFTRMKDTLVRYCGGTVNTGINENKQEGFQIYPVPASAQLYINTPSEADLTLVNSLGVYVYQTAEKKGKTEINTSDFIPGLYSLILKTKGKTQVVKIIISR